MTKIDDEIAGLKSEIQKLEREKNLLELSDNQRLSILLHSILCNWNHTDGCGWFYEINKDGTHQWDGAAHAPYLQKARKLIKYAKEKNMDVVDLIGIYEVLKEL